MAETLKERMVREGADKVLIHWIINHPEGLIVTTNGPVSVAGRRAVACDMEKTGFIKSVEAGTGETHAVNCPKCMDHPRFAEEYEPGPKMKRYEDIPAEVRAWIEAHEAKKNAGT